MARAGRIFIAEPQDFVLAGEELNDLTAELSPYGEQLYSMIVDNVSPHDGHTLTGPKNPGEANEICIDAIRTTLGELSCAPSNTDLQNVIVTCWDRNDKAAERSRILEVSGHRQGLLSYASWNALNRGIVTLSDKDSKIVLPEATPA